MSFIVTDGMGTQVISIESLQETIRTQQAEIDRLTEQRDRLRVAFVQNMIRAFPDKTHSEISTLIAEIEAGK